VHQSSCNQDFSCLDGDCPSFLEVLPGRIPARPELEDVSLPRPEKRRRDVNIYMVGIGGTGVVTANQILATAAALEEKHVLGLDQTGLSQKGGPVVSHLKILDEAKDVSNQVAGGEADVYLAFDVLTGAASSHLSRARPDRTVAVVSTTPIPTGSMVSHVEERFPDVSGLRRRIDAHTRSSENAYFDAVALSEHFFSDHMPANTIVLGACYQMALLPLEKWSLEKAIELNGVAVEDNRAAFRLGRRIIVEPGFLDSLDLRRSAAMPLDGLVGLVPELIAYQDADYARRYSDFVSRVAARERECIGNGTRLSDAVARHLFQLMAYKDEYEVARLHTSPELAAAIVRTFGEGARYRYLLHPPFLRALGLERKLAVPGWVLRLLKHFKFLRGTKLDPFGYARVRKLERALIEEYRSSIETLLSALSPSTYESAVAIAESVDRIRGYEEVKLRNVERYRKEESRAPG
jgi:indolepyruvate ferredoxin oxidoreductase